MKKWYKQSQYTASFEDNDWRNLKRCDDLINKIAHALRAEDLLIIKEYSNSKILRNLEIVSTEEAKKRAQKTYDKLERLSIKTGDASIMRSLEQLTRNELEKDEKKKTDALGSIAYSMSKMPNSDFTGTSHGAMVLVGNDGKTAYKVPFIATNMYLPELANHPHYVENLREKSHVFHVAWSDIAHRTVFGVCLYSEIENTERHTHFYVDEKTGKTVFVQKGYLKDFLVSDTGIEQWRHLPALDSWLEKYNTKTGKQGTSKKKTGDEYVFINGETIEGNLRKRVTESILYRSQQVCLVQLAKKAYRVSSLYNRDIQKKRRAGKANKGLSYAVVQENTIIPHNQSTLFKYVKDNLGYKKSSSSFRRQLLGLDKGQRKTIDLGNGEFVVVKRLTDLEDIEIRNDGAWGKEIEDFVRAPITKEEKEIILEQDEAFYSFQYVDFIHSSVDEYLSPPLKIAQ